MSKTRNGRPGRILIECSYLCEHPDFNTGIQRVIRSVVRHLGPICRERGMELQLVSLADGRVAPVPDSAIFSDGPTACPTPISSVRSRARRLYLQWRSSYISMKHRLVHLLPWSPLHRFLFPPDGAGGLDGLLHATLINPGRRLIHGAGELLARRSPQLRASPGDLLLLMDGSWHMNVWPGVRALARDGVEVWAVIYDLIPLLHRSMCDDFLCRAFSRWLHSSFSHVVGYLAISRAVEGEVRSWMAARFGEEAVSRKVFTHFYLGADFSGAPSPSPRPDLEAAFQGPVYLVVSTLAPHKNHACVLDAFDLLWERGLEVRLCLVGRMGWRVDSLVERLRSHREWGRRLFWWDDLDDGALEYCYSRARCLVAPSWVEGFGLPVVEGMARGLPVMASAIPVFREIGGDSCLYFDPASPSDLAALVEAVERGRLPLPRITHYRWLTWRDSTAMLLERLGL